MAFQEIHILQPNFFNKFSCIGPSCKDNCCHDWELPIDKSHYLRYRSEHNQQFKELCKRYVKRDPKSSSPDHFATLLLKEDGRCGFQDEDRGCRILRLLGPEALSTTCSVYPRRKAQFIQGYWEYSLSLSCAEAARLALFSQEPLEFSCVCKTLPPKEDLDQMTPLGIGKNGAVVPPPSYGVSLRQSCMKLMGLHSYSLQERILAVGLLLRRIDRLLSVGTPERIPEFCIQFLNAVEDGEFSGFFDHLEYLSKAHRAAMQLPAAHLLAGARQPVMEHLWEVLKPWCEISPSSGEYLIGERAMDFLIQAARESGDHLLSSMTSAAERYFLNYMFSSLFPFLYRWEGLSFEEHGILLAEQYALLRILLSIDSRSTEPQERMINTVVSLSRLCQHADLGQDLVKLSRTVQLDGLAHAAYLLR